MFAFVALGKGVGSTKNEHRLCEVGRASMTAGYDLDEKLSKIGGRSRTQETYYGGRIIVAFGFDHFTTIRDDVRCGNLYVRR